MKLTRRISILLIISLLSSTLFFGVSAAGGSIKSGVGFVNTGSLRLREGPSTATATLAYATQDEVVVILEQTGSWYKVLYNLKEGYMHADYLNVAAVENAELGYGRVNDTSVNMRTGPGTGYRSIGKSNTGDMAYVIGLNKGWYKVIWQDAICYIRSDFLDLTEAPYENRANPKSPIFFRGGWSFGTPVSVENFKNSANYIGASKNQAIIDTAMQYIGVPYLWGGTTPAGFDCSGFTQYVFRQHGISINRTTSTQYQNGYYVAKSDLQAGDLVFFQNTYREGISHVGIYLGDGRFVHASSSVGVTVTSMDNSYWASRYYGARRVL